MTINYFMKHSDGFDEICKTGDGHYFIKYADGVDVVTTVSYIIKSS